jgi:cell division protein FtsL
MRLSGLFNSRVRGFRIVELGGLAVLIVLVLAVYLAKAGAGGKRADIDRVQDQIVDEKARIRLLQAEVASLERPERLEALSNRYLAMQPIAAKHEVDADALPDIALAPVAEAKPAAAMAPTAVNVQAQATPDPAGVEH